MPKSHRYFSIPNLLTLLNLTSGFVAVILALSNNYYLLEYASIAIFVGMLFDFLDGFSARLLKQYSAIGKELDSLADLITFGVAPAAIVFQLLKTSLKIKEFSLDIPFAHILVLLAPVILIAFSALRLAKFNIDDRQSDIFLGIPTPLSAFFFASLPLLKEFNPDELILISKLLDISLPMITWAALIGLQVFVMENIYFYLIFIAIFAPLLLIEIPMFSLKFKNFKFKQNKLRYIFLSTSLILIILFQSFSLPLIVLFYIIISLFKNIRDKIKNKQSIVE